jgi:hypothetical protein
MEIFKEKDESEVNSTSLDPESGIFIDNTNIDFDNFKGFGQQSPKAKAYANSHRNKIKHHSDLEEVESNFNQKESLDAVMETLVLEEPDLNETLVSIEELLDFLDSSEEQIDV